MSIIDYSHEIEFEPGTGQQRGRLKPVKDGLERSSMAQEIASKIINEISDPRPRIFGIYGWWGSGKSHLMHQVMAHLEREQENRAQEGIKIVYCLFKAWQYEMSSDLAAGLITVLKPLEPEKRAIFDKGAPECIADFILKLLPLVGPAFGPLGAGVSAGAQLIKLGVDNLHDYRKKLEELSALDRDPHDLLAQKMQELVNSILGVTEENRSSSKVRLVIFIDDLDRCCPENMVHMFEWLKVHLRAQHCTYVLGLDHIAAARAIVGRYKEYLEEHTDLEYGLRYLEKLVDMEFELGYAPEVEKMAIHEVFGDNQNCKKLSELICNGSGAIKGLGSFPGMQYVDTLLQLRTLKTPRTMLKIISKFAQVWGKLQSSDSKYHHLYNRLGLSSPFWVIFLIAMYYRLDPDWLDDFIRANGAIYDKMAGLSIDQEEEKIISEKRQFSPVREFYDFAGKFVKQAGATVFIPKGEDLQYLAEIIRQNA